MALGNATRGGRMLTLRYQEKTYMRKQRQRTGEQRSIWMMKHTLYVKDVIKKQRGGFK
jgi:hypothetical protein